MYSGVKFRAPVDMSFPPLVKMRMSPRSVRSFRNLPMTVSLWPAP